VEALEFRGHGRTKKTGEKKPRRARLFEGKQKN
jgi:hypothetical protein